MTNEFGLNINDNIPELMRPYIGEYVKLAVNGVTTYGCVIESTSEFTRLNPFLNDYSTPKLKDIRLETSLPLTLRTSAIICVAPTTRQYLESLCIQEEIKQDEKTA